MDSVSTISTTNIGNGIIVIRQERRRESVDNNISNNNDNMFTQRIRVEQMNQTSEAPSISLFQPRQPQQQQSQQQQQQQQYPGPLSKNALLFSTSLTTFLFFYLVKKYGLRKVFGYGVLTAMVYKTISNLYTWVQKRFRYGWLRRGSDFFNGNNRNSSSSTTGGGRVIQIQTSRFHLNPYVNSQLSLMLVDDFTPAHYDILLRLDEDLPNRGAASEEVIRSLPQITLTADDDDNTNMNTTINGNNSNNNEKSEEQGEREQIHSSSSSSSTIPVQIKKEVHEGWGVCAICMEPMIPNQKITICPCLHKFHSDGCIIPWLRVKGTCPVCQKRVDAQ